MEQEWLDARRKERDVVRASHAAVDAAQAAVQVARERVERADEAAQAAQAAVASSSDLLENPPPLVRRAVVRFFI